MGEVDQATKDAAAAKARAAIKEEVLATLHELNPNRVPEVAIYVDAFLDYREAQANIDLYGSVTFHPRTGAPIDNPYLRIRDRAAACLGKSRLKTGALWLS